MLYDVFICHASEDKEGVVRPLAERLRQSHTEVWYDEFSLKAGDSLRRSIDLGLSQSRFGVVVLSHAFFGKGWPQWELDGLVQRQISGGRTVIVPVWHGVTREDVESYSPPLADKVAISSTVGLDEMVKRILAVIRPEGSTLLIARDILIDYGLEPPVVTDDWWLDIVEDVSEQRWKRWSLPLPFAYDEGEPPPRARGKRLAWCAMEQIWQERADEEAISQLRHPGDVLEFIETSPGLREAVQLSPARVLFWAPQLGIRGLGGWLEPAFDEILDAAVRESTQQRERDDPYGTALTTNALAPACDETIALRHPTFGDYESVYVANSYVDGNSGGLGPGARLYDIIDYAVWFLSEQGTWLPSRDRAYLLAGMKDWATWLWSEHEQSYSEFKHTEHTGRLWEFLHRARDSGVHREVTLSPAARADLEERLAFSCKILSLPEPPEEIITRFLASGYIEKWMDHPKRIARKRARWKAKSGRAARSTKPEGKRARRR